ncbi:MAG: thiamine phosphate synthase [Sulfurovum sp.]|nr:thiamine phosphate synthase [Sulfurovum sp.]MDD3602554.1 thiamine phosphate synthase [Sulfurovum sp.]
MFFYAITDPSTLDFNSLDEELQRFAKKASMIVYRDKTNKAYALNAKKFIEAARQLGFEKVLLHGDAGLAKSCGAHGVHLRSDQFDQVKEAKAADLFVVVSTHTLQEARQAEMLGADMVTFSPIFDTPHKGEPVGLAMLERFASSLSIPVIALGGIITQAQIDACIKAGAEGVASIRYFA